MNAILASRLLHMPSQQCQFINANKEIERFAGREEYHREVHAAKYISTTESENAAEGLEFYCQTKTAVLPLFLYTNKNSFELEIYIRLIK